MSISRRRLIYTTAAASCVRLRAQDAEGNHRVFRRGVASGDPLSNRVIMVLDRGSTAGPGRGLIPGAGR
jgi:phosphodiesterase/alkaline phosphatase D-like protein